MTPSELTVALDRILSASPADEVLARHHDQLAKALEAGARGLDDSSRVLLSAYFLEQKPIRELAEAAGMAPMSLARLIHKARRALISNARQAFQHSAQVPRAEMEEIVAGLEGRLPFDPSLLDRGTWIIRSD